MWWTLLALAHSAELTPHVGGQLVTAPAPSGGTAGATLGLPLGMVQPELRADLGWAGGFQAGGTLQARALLGQRQQLHPSLTLGAGGGIHGAHLAGGLALDIPTRGPMVRVEVQVQGFPTEADTRSLLSAGVVFGRKGTAPEPEPVVVEAPAEPAPPEAPAALPAVQADAEGMVWLPDPVCEWLPPVDAQPHLATVGLAFDDLVLETPALTAPPTPPGAESPLAQGSLVLVSAAQDVAYVDDVAVDLSEGLAVVNHPEGEANVSFVGGGRRLAWPVAVADGHALWVVADPPPVHRVTFAAGRSVLDSTAKSTLVQVATTAGDWRFTVQGAYSPDGTLDKNIELANARAEAAIEALVDGGVPRDHIQLLPPIPPEDSASPESQRAAVITPVEAL